MQNSCLFSLVNKFFHGSDSLSDLFKIHPCEKTFDNKHKFQKFKHFTNLKIYDLTTLWFQLQIGSVDAVMSFCFKNIVVIWTLLRHASRYNFREKCSEFSKANFGGHFFLAAVTKILSTCLCIWQQLRLESCYCRNKLTFLPKTYQWNDELVCSY